MTLAEVNKIMALLATEFHFFTVNEPRRRLWYQRLKYIPFNVAWQAANQYIDTQHDTPQISDIKKLCLSAIQSGQLSPQQAWGEVKQKILYKYSLEGALLSDSTYKTVEEIGWVEFKQCTPEREVWLRKEFLQVYERLQKQQQMTQFKQLRGETPIGGNND